MSKVDWIEAEVKYVTKPEASYEWLAQLFGTAKSTIVRHATKEEWPKKRKEYKQKRIKALEDRILETSSEVDARHLKILRNTQVSFHNRIIELSLKQQMGEPVEVKAWRAVANLTNAMTKAIMTERAILGLPTKRIRVTDPEAIDNIQRQKGFKTDPSYQKYRETKALLEGIDIEAILKHKKILESYVAEVEKEGDYGVKHPLW